jgi:sugar lactone lactonase YvrE
MGFVALSLLIGVTVAGYGNGTSGTANNALNIPWGLALGVDGSLFISDYSNHRVMKIQEGNLTGSIIAGAGVGGSSTTQLMNPTEIAVDAASNLYVNDDYNYRVMLWRKNSSTGVIVAGTGVSGNSINQIGTSAGLAIDSQGNIYVVDHGNNRVMKWVVNATYGTLVAGITDVAGSNNTLFNQPYGLYLDENNSYIYIADLANSRIQRYQLGISANGTTVAGGNGLGPGSNQFNAPYAVCVSKKTGDIYVADTGNHRIQRWSPGATSGVTIIGVTGVSGIDATLLNGPTYVVLSMNETFLYVSDGFNNRVQRFQLP